MKSLTNYQLERFTTVEFLPFGLDWTCVAEIQFSENKDLPNDNDPPRRQKARNSTVEGMRMARNGAAFRAIWDRGGWRRRPSSAGATMAYGSVCWSWRNS